MPNLNHFWSFFNSLKTKATPPSTIPPILFARAQAIATEHSNLSKELENKYDVQTAKKAGELAKTADLVNELSRLKDVSSATNRTAELF